MDKFNICEICDVVYTIRRDKIEVFMKIYDCDGICNRCLGSYLRKCQYK